MKVIYDNKEYEYELIYKKIKNAYIRISNGKFKVTASKRFTRADIETFIINSLPKILKKQNESAVDLNVYDDSVMIWGKTYDLIKVQGDNQIVFTDKMIGSFQSLDKEYVCKIMQKWYTEQTEIYLRNNLLDFEKRIAKFNLVIKRVRIKKLKSRWGSCNYNTQEIVINCQLAKLDPKYIEFVLCHEAAHLKHPNHSKDFYDFLSIISPNHKEYRKDLRKYNL